MKKILSPRSDLLALITVTLALIFVLVAQAPRQATAATNCQVCHNGKNPHTVTMSCKDVQQWVDKHPGDYAGPCQGVTNEQP
jgi:ribosomal protein L32